MTAFDSWLTTPPDDPPEPSQRHLDDARDELPEDATDEEVYNLACMLLADEIRQSEDDAAMAAAELREDDRMERYGDGPW